jgi:iron complex outermembrane receptor protein
MKRTGLLFLLFSLLLSALPGWAQQFGSIYGRVTTTDGDPAEAVSVGVQGQPMGDLTNAEGYYTIKAVPAGTYTLVVSFVGLKPAQQPVTVVAGQRTQADFRLAESTAELQEVVVQGARTNKFNRPSSEYVGKMPLKNLENPQVYSTVGKELLTEQLVFTADDATRNAPGVQKMWDATGRGGDGGGFYGSRGFIVSSQLRNGVAGNVTSDIDAVNLEKLEVIKGPSATLFGSALTSYGGLLNRVTKKPLDTFGGELTVAGGSYAFHRVSADVNLVDQNAPADQPKALAFRLNTAYTYEDSYQTRDYTGFSKNLAVAPSLQWRPTDRLTVNLDAEIYQGSGTGKQMVFFYFPASALGFDRADKAPLDYRQSYAGPGLVQDSRSTNLFGQVQYRISPAFTSTTYLSTSHSFSNGFGPYFYLKPGPGGAASDTLVRADQSTGNSRRTLFEVQQLFNGDFQLGRLRNRVVLGLDYLRIDPKINFLGGDIDKITLDASSAAIRGFNGPAVAARYAAQAPGSYLVNVQSNTYSVFASDVLNLTEQLSLLAAVRLDHIDSKAGLFYSPVEAYTQTLLSPKFGVVFQPVKDRVALFANYQNSFKNLGVYLNPEEQFPLARPERANQWEAGVKLDAAGGRLSATLSYYDIYVKDLLRNVGYSAKYNFRSIDVQDANQRSKGVEVSIIANPLRGFNVVAGFGYNDSKLETPDEKVNGRRPNTASSPVVANAWLSYRQPAGPLKGLGLGFGGNYANENRIQNTADNVFTLPSYTVLNASIFYDQPRYRLAAKVDNLTDQQYWTGYTTMNPQKLRSIIGSVAYKF